MAASLESFASVPQRQQPLPSRSSGPSASITTVPRVTPADDDASLVQRRRVLLLVFVSDSGWYICFAQRFNGQTVRPCLSELSCRFVLVYSGSASHRLWSRVRISSLITSLAKGTSQRHQHVTEFVHALPPKTYDIGSVGYPVVVGRRFVCRAGEIAMYGRRGTSSPGLVSICFERSAVAPVSFLLYSCSGTRDMEGDSPWTGCRGKYSRCRHST
ncbi:hypothetical protein CONLIGDRAFT_226268 [Coniochaeta ligniaria NRRL 30616]|uniref:Uncharacterized protein n=1 Tax=Coniochaeta ligniaria NRRL 30616 TaxID=1408157 RepID=A0A1J7I482_9PEZI|nr:hypothetical protein CONLIGDRAFT_226268 [Coniochaeta ligniaria NRRL 30616]